MLTSFSGRNMHQCVEAIERMSIPVPSLKRKSWEDDQEERPAKRISYPDVQEHMHHTTEQRPNTPLPSGLAMPMTGYRRPSNGQAPNAQHRTVASEPPKKRGRPSRADKAKRDLRPLLPQPPATALAPVPSPVSTNSRPMSSHAQPAQPAQSPSALQPLQPAFLPSFKMAPQRSITPPGAYVPAARQVRSPPAISPSSRVQGSPSEDTLHPTLCKAGGAAGLPDNSNLRVLVE